MDNRKGTSIIVAGSGTVITLLTILGLNAVGIICLVVGFAMLSFSMWQLNMMTSGFVDCDIDTSIRYFTDIKGNGYKRWRDVPFTINMYIWPKMKAGEAYDDMMIVNFASVAPIIIGIIFLIVPIINL